MSGSGIYKILTGRCGSKWVQKFHSESLGIDTAVETEIPPLLDAETIAQIKTKSAGRRIWDHNRSLKHDYLLSRMIFDHESGYALTGVTLRNTRYYRCYGQYRRGNGCIGINARLLEEALLESLFETLGSSEALQKAVFDGNPTSKVAETLRVKRSECLKELKAVEKKLANMVNAMADYGEDTGLFTQKVKEQIKTLEQQHGKLAFELDKINNDLRSLPTGQEVENLASQLLQRIKENYLTAGCAFQSLPFNEKRKILKLLFGGVDGNGKRFGVYVSSVTGGTKFEACGRLGAFDGWLDTRSGESYTEGLALKPDKETITAIGNVIKEDNPGLGCSEKLSFLCPYLIHQPHIGL